MEFEKRRSPVKPIDLVALINIVFLLLIFFMLTSALAPPDTFDVELPESKQGQAGSAQPIVVLISGGGELALNADRITIGELEEALARAQEENPEARLLIKADAQATTGDVAAVLRRARAAGVERVGLATLGGS